MNTNNMKELNLDEMEMVNGGLYEQPAPDHVEAVCEFIGWIISLFD